MTIAFSTGLLPGEQPEGYDNFVFECVTRLAKRFPQHHFLLIADSPLPAKFTGIENISILVTGPLSNNPLVWQYRFNYKIPPLLRKHKADVFVCMHGICSLRTKLPQCLVIRDLSFLQYPQFFKKKHAWFYKKFTPAFLKKSKSIATVSGFSKTLMTGHYKINADKIDVVYGGVDEVFRPIIPEEKENIKETYTDGREYFLFAGVTAPRADLMGLLKAFSFFKKRQKSNMMLLVAGETDEQFTRDLRTFKFRDDVKLIRGLSKQELAPVMAAAYAFVYPCLYEDFAEAPLQAMQCGVPVVCSNRGALPELYGDAALYMDPADFKDIADKMMTVFKDENKAKELVEAGKTRAQGYHWDKTAGLVWQAIVKAIDN